MSVSETDFTGFWLASGGGYFMKSRYIVKMIRTVSDWVSYAGQVKHLKRWLMQQI